MELYSLKDDDHYRDMFVIQTERVSEDNVELVNGLTFYGSGIGWAC